METLCFFKGGKKGVCKNVLRVQVLLVLVCASALSRSLEQGGGALKCGRR